MPLFLAVFVGLAAEKEKRIGNLIPQVLYAQKLKPDHRLRSGCCFNNEDVAERLCQGLLAPQALPRSQGSS